MQKFYRLIELFLGSKKDTPHCSSRAFRTMIAMKVKRNSVAVWPEPLKLLHFCVESAQQKNGKLKKLLAEQMLD